MASIRERNGKFNVIYSYTNEKGERKQKWETYETKAEAKRRKKEIEYKKEMGSFVVRKCKTLDELITEYVALYGKENWALSTYEGNVSLINNYILPIIGDTKLSEINTRFIERYYQSLLKRQQDDIKVIEVKDYIKNPKPNGYRSYHMIVEIPVFFAKGKTPMRVELQIRTNGMDFWATLEHQLRYKKGIEEMPGYEEISEELLHSARVVIEADNEMQRIKDKIGMFHEI